MNGVTGPDDGRILAQEDAFFRRERELRLSHEAALDVLDQELAAMRAASQRATSEASMAREAAIAAFGEEYVVGDNVEQNEVWRQLEVDNSVAFNTNFIERGFPLIRKMAQLHLDCMKKQLEVLGLEERRRMMVMEHEDVLRQLSEDRAHNSLLPCELYRLIFDLRTELAEVKAEFNVMREEVGILKAEKAAREAAEAAAAAEAARRPDLSILKFSVLTNPNVTSFQAPVNNRLPCQLTQSSKGHQAAIARGRLPHDRSVSWTVEITVASHWICLGVIGTNQGLFKESYSHATCYGWACSNQVYSKGVNTPSHGGWTGWSTGDRATLTYNPLLRTLTANVTPTYGENAIYAIANIELDNAYVHCNLFDANTVVNFTDLSYA